MFNRIKNVSEWILHQFFKILVGGLWTMGPSYTVQKLHAHTRGKLTHHIPSTSGLSWQKCDISIKYQHPINKEWIQMHHLHPVFTNKEKKLGGTLLLTREENNSLFKRAEHTLALRLYSGSSQNSQTVLEKIFTINLQKRLRMDHLHNFFRNFLGETTPPPPYCEKIKNLPSWALYLFSSTVKMKIFPHHVYRQSEIWRQNYTHFFFRNQHELCKKGLRIHHLHQLPKQNQFGEIPNPWPYCEKIKNSLLGFIWSSKAEVLILPHHVYRNFEGKNYTQIWRRSQHELRKKNGLIMHHLHPFFKNVPGEGPGPPPAAGASTPTPSPKRCFAPIWLPPPPQAVDPLDTPLLEVRFALAHWSDLNRSQGVIMVQWAVSVH